MSDADTAPNGSVATHASRISRTLPQLASSLRSKPMPKIAPDVTCVVETGSANGEARVTSVAATKLAATASRVAIGVIFPRMPFLDSFKIADNSPRIVLGANDCAGKI